MNRKVNEKKKEINKGITLIALVITIIVLIILAGVSINVTIGQNGVITRAKQAKEDMETAANEEQEQLAKLVNELESNEMAKINKNEPNPPKLAQGMSPIKFIDPTEETKGDVLETVQTDSRWYDYDEKKWANAQTEDGSMWVWIPRYAYRVNEETQTFDVVFLMGDTDNYYDDEGNLQTAKRCTREGEAVDTTTGYTVHPAFTDETAINFRNGGWDKELTGIWVAKFEAGYASGNNTTEVKASSVNYTQNDVVIRGIERGESLDGHGIARNWLDGIYGETITAIKYPVFQPTTYSMNYLDHNDAYNIAKVLTESENIYGLTKSTDSHLMKSSEWGAVAYLSQSKYGLNGTDIAINNINLNSGGSERTAIAGKSGVDSVYAVTGCTTGTSDAEEKTTTIASINSTTGNSASDEVYTWDQINGTKASSSGTIYGIYDLSGGNWEITAAYIANNNKFLKTYGEDFSYDGNVLKSINSKYTMVYPYDSSIDNTEIENTESNLDTASANNWKKNTLIYGDAIQETSTSGMQSTSWYGDFSHYMGLYKPFLVRGGFIWNGKNGAGLFSFLREYGYTTYYVGFRAVLIVG